MIEWLKKTWKALRKRKALSLAFDVGAIVLVMLAIHAWQTRGMPFDEPAPAAELMVLGGSVPQSSVEPGAVGVVYFFAPWCKICHASIGHLDELVSEGSVAWAHAIALDYPALTDVQKFVDDTQLEMPVLLGNHQEIRDWNIRAFPTYFVIDEEGRIASRSVGYSTKIGLRARTWLAK